MKSALIVIDVQRGLFDAEPRPAEADAVVARINGLTARARAADVPVIFVHHERAEGELKYGTPGWDLQQQLHAEAVDHRIRKTTPDSFLRTDLEELLLSLEVQKVVLCGYATEFCVDTTTRRSAALGYEVILAADAHTTHDKAHATAGQIRRHHNATLPDISSFGPKISAVNAADIQFT
ncbi:cysteine hydrolase family protein [Undibacterium sp.]|uniref:cysteine hydrolase family protein n=1 Tax=Undibacterium sp. TaxID=1914977 RepID=UPI002C749E9E|nr:cysteine hydrolase family protein [Undibacterium sp.]HTD03918.1 cysteine hydrolase family protein [Undibacterium sp.]